ncbi:SH3 domain-containing protein [Glaciecola siphonariae]|uniref:SH3 domain-containing protein n=1 Tax=Glaciecola siphonariae TaxID=521012 RepID=A0ABV9LQJ0_9ALTE
MQSVTFNKRCLWLGAVFFGLVYSTALAADELSLVVTSPYIDVHTGPASAYPVFHVLEKGERIDILKSRTNWYKVRAYVSGGNTLEGWIEQSSLMSTALEDGSAIFASSGSFDDYQIRDWEITIAGGVLDSISAMTVSGAWVWTRNLSVEASYTQALGDFSDNKIWSLRMRHTLFPAWRVSPYFALGTGEIRTQPRANLVQSGDEVRKSSHYEIGAGLRYYFAKSMLVKLEYRSLLALTDRDEQERLDQWMLGASVFF